MFDRIRQHHELSPYERGRRDAYEQGLDQILARIDRLENIVVAEVIALLKLAKTENEMKQSTQDLVDAVTGLKGTVDEVSTAIDALVAAQASNDDAAVEEQVNILKGLGPQLKSHLPTVADAGTAVAQAPEDAGAQVQAS